MVAHVLLFVIFTSILVLGITLLAQGSAPHDPFAPYAHLLSRQRVFDGIQGNRSLFSCLLVSSDTMSCTFEPHDNHFSQILVSIRRDTPDHTSFSVIDHALRVGDLVALWGLPDTPFAGTTSRLVWPENNGVVVRVFTAPVDKIDYFTPVQLLLFSFIG